MESRDRPLAYLEAMKKEADFLAEARVDCHRLWHGVHPQYGEILILVRPGELHGSFAWGLGG